MPEEDDLPTPLSELGEGATWNIPPEQDFYEQLADAADADEAAQTEGNGRTRQLSTEEAFRALLERD
jgi:hypothetical protein